MKKIFFVSVLMIVLSSLRAQTETEIVPSDTTKKEDVFTIVEKMPEFPGGQDGLTDFLANNLVYPADAKKKGIEGKVWASFNVDKFGNVYNVEILKGIGYGCDEEVIRVIKLMPRWTPGTQDGRPVIVKFRLPINFALK